MLNEMLSKDEHEYNDKIRELVKEACSGNKGSTLAKPLDHTRAHFYSAAALEGEREQFEQILLNLVLPAWIRVLDTRLQFGEEYGRECSLREHCDLLSRTIFSIGSERHLPHKLNKLNGAILAWGHAAEWLEVAASVERVEVDTSYFDDSTELCGTAYDYQRARSLDVSSLVTELTMFNLVWGSLETVIKLIDPPKVPKGVKGGRTSLVDRALYYLKIDYEPRSPVPFYKDTVAAFNDALKGWQPRLLEHSCLVDHVSLSGISLGVVRRIRNEFAHGAAHMPEPDEDSDGDGSNAKIINLSSRIPLYTIQLLLSTHLNQTSFELAVRKGEHDELLSEEVHYVLRSLHVKHQGLDETQLLLFDP
jgi:hypothetical protein